MSDTVDTVAALRTAAEKAADAEKERKALLKQRIVGGSSLILTFLVLCALIVLWPTSDPSDEVSVRKTYEDFRAEARAEVEKEISDKAVEERFDAIKARIADLEKSKTEPDSGAVQPPQGTSAALNNGANSASSSVGSEAGVDTQVNVGDSASTAPQPADTPASNGTPSVTNETPKTQEGGTDTGEGKGDKNGNKEGKDGENTTFLEKLDTIEFETRLLLIVLLSGALGSLVHTLTSFARHIGVGDYSERWTWWYILRVPIGMALAMIMYFSLRGGFFVPTTTGQVEAKDIVNPFGFATVAALAGMFSKQAVDKLKELFDVIFKVKKPPIPSVPKISRIAPASLTVAQKNAALTLVGTDFREDTIVQVNGVARETAFLNSQALTLIPAKDDLAKAGSLEIYAINTGKLGGTSDTITVPVSKAATT